MTAQQLHMATGPVVGRPEETAGAGPRPLRVIDLGLISYAECWDLQNRLAEQVGDGFHPETLLLLEHPHTFTCGRRGGRNHILVGDEVLEQEGITVLDVDRGGDVTYHGPGQLVAYPIINLHAYGERIDYPGYVRMLEEALIRTLADFHISSHRIPGYSGVWVDRYGREEKIAAIGVRVNGRGITTHGIALNVTTDLHYFGYIIPCGISDRGVTSMARLLESAPGMPQVKQSFARHFGEVFGFAPQPAPVPAPSI
jgi:lipoate-protein ligase B